MIRLTRDIIDYHALTEEVRRAGARGGALRHRARRRAAVTVALDTTRIRDGGKKMAEIEAETRQPGRSARSFSNIAQHLDVGDISVAVAVSCRIEFRRLKRAVTRSIG